MQKYDIAAYVWPAYTGDERRSRIFWPDGIGEWQTVKAAAENPDFPGNSWPRRPLWGYVNEADPAVMETEIDAAADHGVNVFIYDWYWYDGRPFLENCLNDGFLKARNRDRMRFFLMWANHDATTCWDRRTYDDCEEVVWTGKVDRRRFEEICERLIGRYFGLPCYYKIGGCPVFQIYDLQNLLDGLGGLNAVREALCWFRGRAKQAGFPDLHLILTKWGEGVFNVSGVDRSDVRPDREVILGAGFDSLTNYQFVHLTDMNRDYREILADIRRIRENMADFGLPSFPHVSVGWDNNPRHTRPASPVVKNNTPEAFRAALEDAKAYADSHPLPAPLITVNSWNEWTETSFLEPDDRYGFGYLEAIKDVFG